MAVVSRACGALLALCLLAPLIPLGGAEVSPPLDTNNGSAPGDGILETLYGFEWIIEPGDNVTYSNVTISLRGGLSVLPGGRLNLHHVLLVANATGITMRVDPNGILEITDSRVDSGPLTNGAPEGTLEYSFLTEAGALLRAHNVTFAHVGRQTGRELDAGLYIRSASSTLDEVAIVDSLNGLVLDNATTVRVTNVTITNSAGVDLLLLGASSLEFAGGAFNTTSLNGSSHVDISYFVDARLIDLTGRPIPGMDLFIQSVGRDIFKSGAFGGTDPRTAILPSGDHAPRWVEVPAWMREGNLTPAPFPVEVSASYAEWSEHRSLVLSSNTALTFLKRLDAPVNFTEGAAVAGLDDPAHLRGDLAAGPSAAWADIDRDGDSDLFVAGGAGGSGPPAVDHLYRSDGGGAFTDITVASNISSSGSSAASFADFDNDGYPDLYLLKFGSAGAPDSPGAANVLLHNNRDGTFTDVTARAGVGGLAHGVAAAWADFDRDGYLDLFVVNRGVSSGGVDRPESSVLYRSRGDGTFADVTGPAGLLTPGTSTCAMWFDFNNDGWPDLMVGRDSGASPLYRNNGDGTFTDVTAAAGMALEGSARALAARDVDGNGWLDVFSAEAGPDRLWMNDRGNFTDEAAARGVDSPLAGTAAVFADVDADGDPDLMVANGRADTPKAFASPQLFRNDGTGHFVDVSAESGFVAPPGDEPTTALAAGEAECGPMFLARPSTANLLLTCSAPASAPAPLAVTLRGTDSNLDAVGARVTLTAGDGFSAWEEITGGAASQAGRPAQVHLSVGAHGPAVNITVLWPSGIRETRAGPFTSPVTLVEPAEVTVSAGPDRTVSAGERVNFSAAVTASSDPDFAAHARFSWTLSGANLSITLVGANTSFTFPAFGVWQAQVTATDPSTGLAANASATLQVRDSTRPSAHILDPADGAEFDLFGTLHVAASATDNDPAFGASGNFTWLLQGPGTNVTLYGPTASLTMHVSGAYTLTLTVADAASNVARQTVNLRVRPATCTGCGGTDWTVPLALLGALVGAAGVVLIRRLFPKPGAPSAKLKPPPEE